MSKYNVNANVNKVVLNYLTKMKAYHMYAHSIFLVIYSFCIEYIDDLSQAIQTYPGLADGET